MPVPQSSSHCHNKISPSIKIGMAKQWVGNSSLVSCFGLQTAAASLYSTLQHSWYCTIACNLLLTERRTFFCTIQSKAALTISDCDWEWARWLQRKVMVPLLPPHLAIQTCRTYLCLLTTQRLLCWRNPAIIKWRMITCRLHPWGRPCPVWMIWMTSLTTWKIRF